MIYVTRIEHFNAAHQLWNPDWSDEKNAEFYGKCANKNYHGHNYELHVTVKGEVNPETGFLINAKELSKLIKDIIIEEADHRNLNVDVPFMEGKMTSAENFTIAIWDELKSEVEKLNAKMHYIKLVETPKIYIEYYG
jgi:6-pyruvoyltetrahydropterin/6-carboxytetrahydropterin synthase